MEYYNEMLDTDRVYFGKSSLTRKRLREMGSELIYTKGIGLPANVLLQYDRVSSPVTFDLSFYAPEVRNNGRDRTIINRNYCEIENPYIKSYNDMYTVFIVNKGELFGLIDNFGHTLIPVECNTLYFNIHSCVREPYIIVKKEHYAYLYCVLRFRRTSPIFDDIKVVSQHSPCGSSTDLYFKAYKDGKCGLVHQKGNVVVPLIYDDCFGACYYFHNDEKHKYIIVTKDGKQGILNELGDVIAEIKYDKINFSYPIDYTAKDLLARGYIDTEEFVLIDPEIKEKKNRYRSSRDYDTYERYGGSYAQDEMGYSDDDIDTIFDGDPSAYWNID